MKKKTKSEICLDCKSKMVEKVGEYEPGFTYRYWKCPSCGREILNMEQLGDAAKRWKKFAKIPKATISKWGTALAIRIPREVVKKQNIKVGESALILPEKNGFRVIPERE